ncbi:MAG TPA: BPSS1780 family membrane protein [Gammaproteobacteria bacterium]|nr:BPSS1780 family membrane protein [Gammaproteobacteria bacterium]
MADNPYAPPKSHVADSAATLPEGDFIEGGRSVAAGNGWRWITDAWNFMGEQRWTFIGVVLLYFILWIGVQVVPLIGPIAATLFAPVIAGGIMLGCEAVRRGERLEVGHLFAAFQNHIGKLVAVGAVFFGLNILVAIVVIAIMGVSIFSLLGAGAEPSPEQLMGMGMTILLAGLVALAITVPVYMLMWFAAPLIVLGGLDVGQALKASFTGCLKNIVPFLVWGVMMLLFSIVATIPFLLGWLVLGPVITVSVYTSYRDIFHET